MKRTVFRLEGGDKPESLKHICRAFFMIPKVKTWNLAAMCVVEAEGLPAVLFIGAYLQGMAPSDRFVNRYACGNPCNFPGGYITYSGAAEASCGILTYEMADQRPLGGFYRRTKRALHFWYDPERHYGRFWASSLFCPRPKDKVPRPGG